MPAIGIGAIMMAVGIGAEVAIPALIISGASMIVSGMMSLAAGGKKSPALSGINDESRGQLVNICTSQAPVPIAYGRVRVGINRCFATVTGANNEKLHIVGVLSEGPCDSIYNNEVYLGDDLISTYGSDAGYEFINGAADQAYNSALHTYFPNWVDCLRNTCCLYLCFNFNRDKFLNLPDITATLNARTLYDPRVPTTAWSNNGGLVARDITTNDFYSIGLTNIDDDEIETVANWCDTNSYTFNGIIRDRKAAIDVIDDILLNFRGARRWSGGKWKFMVLDYDATVMTLTDDDIIADSHSIELPSVQNVINTVVVKFNNEANGYTIQDIPIENRTDIEADGEDRPEEIILNGTTSYAQAQKIGKYLRKRKRLDAVYGLVARPRAIALEPGDMIKITTEKWGWSEQVCRVTAVSPLENYNIGLRLLKESADLYDDNVDTATHNIYSTTLPNPLAVPPSVINISWDEETYIQGDNTYSRIKIGFDTPADYPFFDYAEVYISWDEGATWKFLGKNAAGFTVETLREGNNFQLKFLSVSTNGIKQSIDSVSASSVSVTGVSTAPANISGFQAVPVGDNVNLRWSPVDPKDLRFYELRYGSAWGTSLLVCQTKSQSWSIPSIRPGEHTFLLKALNTAGIYSADVAIDTRTMYAPNGYSESLGSPYNEDYDSGTHYNTEYVDDGTFGRILKVKANSLLNGNMESWASATDLNNWTEVLVGTSTVNQEAVVINGGVYSCRLDIDASNSEAGVHQSRHLRDAANSLLSFYHRESAANKAMKYSLYSAADAEYLQSDGAWDAAEYWFSVANSDGAWTPVEKSFTTKSAGDYRVYFRNDSAASASIYIDDATLWSEKGKYTGITFDLGSLVIRRLWLSELLIHYYGSGTTWDTFFTPSDTWEGAVPATASWISLLSGITCGDLRILFKYSEDDISYFDVDNFQIYQTQVQLRYFKTEIYIENVSPANYITVEDMNTRVYQAV